MSDDKELLELAAKAAGIEIGFSITSDRPYICNLPKAAEPTYWNPLTDDGDALRLAVKLRLHIGLEDNVVSAWDKDKFGNFQTEKFQDRGDEAATRRAIVRAAAEIGKNMP